MGKALYRTYRSKRLAEIVGQPHITNALEQALKTGAISHAYLFTGPRGVGKTSIARILAHEVNQLPYTDDATHIDIIEIDAASNNGVEDVRDLRDKVHVAPTSAQFKVYIIDEVHMLSKPAFNALLKTLEEPPQHVIFILATTEMHKIPETIVSRTQHYAFKPVPKDEVVAHLKAIAKKEKISIDAGALQLIAEHGGGSFRDSISLLDQVRNTEGKITADTVRALIGEAPARMIHDVVVAVAEQQPHEVITAIQAMKSQGVDASIISRQIIAFLEQDMLGKQPLLDPQKSLSLLHALIDVPGSLNPTVALQVALLRLTFSHTIAPHVAHVSETTAPAVATRSSKPSPLALQRKPSIPAPTNHPSVTAAPAVTPAPSQSPVVPKPATVLPESDYMLSTEQWEAVLLNVKTTYNTLYGLLRMAVPSFESGIVHLGFKYLFHEKRLNDAKNKQIVIDAIGAVTGTKMNVATSVLSEDVAVTPPASTTPATPVAPNDPSIEAISNIFGGVELLES